MNRADLSKLHAKARSKTPPRWAQESAQGTSPLKASIGINQTNTPPRARTLYEQAQLDLHDANHIITTQKLRHKALLKTILILLKAGDVDQVIQQLTSETK